MRRTALVTTALAALIGACGCATSPVDSFDVVYYFYGPDAALKLIDTGEVPPGDRGLADLERAMALLELGRYRESRSSLERAAATIEEQRRTLVTDAEAPEWRPEDHERVLISTVDMAASLALQEPAAAAAAADRAMAAIAEIGCETCRFDFTRAVAALSYEGVGRYRDGLDGLIGVDLLGPAGDLLDELRGRLARGAAVSEPDGLAPPPVEADRSLVVILLLGRGPYKDVDRLAVTSSRTVKWCRYLPRDPQAVAVAGLEIDESAISVELTDVEQLAETSLRSRAERVVAARGEGLAATACDLRDWSSLPDSFQLLSATIALAVDSVDLVYLSPDGDEVDRETIELPPGWTAGRLFVTRRMP